MPIGKTNNPEGKNQYTTNGTSNKLINAVKIGGLTLNQGLLNVKENYLRNRAKIPNELNNKIQADISGAKILVAAHKQKIDEYKNNTPKIIQHTRLIRDSDNSLKTGVQMVQESELKSKYADAIVEKHTNKRAAREAYNKAISANDKLAIASIKAAANRDKLNRLKGK